MAPGAFDPHPHGCPVGLRFTPSEMPDVVTAICLKLRDLLHGSIFVINPSRGQAYPVLYLYTDPDEALPRVVFFPGWEDDGKAARRRVDFARQTTLLQRIHDAGVAGESLESWRGAPSDRTGPGPLQLPLGVPAPQVDEVVHDLFERLGDLLRITVTRVPGRDGPISVTRLYSLVDEKRPRLVLFPGWEGRDERGPEIDASRMDALMARIADEHLPEIPVEALFQ